MGMNKNAMTTPLPPMRGAAENKSTTEIKITQKKLQNT